MQENVSEMELRYLAAMERRGLTPETIYSRRGELRRWFAWLELEGIDWRDATRSTVERWIDGHAELAPRTRYCKLSHVGAFYRWAVREELTATNPVAAVDRPKLPRLLPRPVRPAEVTAAIEAAPTVELRLMLTLMVDAGLRCLEVSTLEWEHVSGGVMFVRGKGGHDRMVGCTERLELELEAAPRIHERVIGRAITAGRVSQIVNAYLASRGMRCTAHQLRHTFATRFYAATSGNLILLQRVMGHASITSTQIYTEVDAAAAIDAARRLTA